jgi:hypothetical protein
VDDADPQAALAEVMDGTPSPAKVSRPQVDLREKDSEFDRGYKAGYAACLKEWEEEREMHGLLGQRFAVSASTATRGEVRVITDVCRDKDT